MITALPISPKPCHAEPWPNQPSQVPTGSAHEEEIKVALTLWWQALRIGHLSFSSKTFFSNFFPLKNLMNSVKDAQHELCCCRRCCPAASAAPAAPSAPAATTATTNNAAVSAVAGVRFNSSLRYSLSHGQPPHDLETVLANSFYSCLWLKWWRIGQDIEKTWVWIPLKAFFLLSSHCLKIWNSYDARMASWYFISGHLLVY